MEKWLESARATLRAHRSVPTDMEQLEDAIQVREPGARVQSHCFPLWMYLLRTSTTYVWKFESGEFLQLGRKLLRNPSLCIKKAKISSSQDHREFLMELDSHKSLMMSVNVIASHLSEHSRDRPRVEALQARLGAVNAEWDRGCEDAADWQAKLQTALLEVRH